MKRHFLLILLTLFTLCISAQPLRFHANGEFKILQLTDLHYILDDPRATVALDCIDKTIAAEQPDLVITTGDNIFGKPAMGSMRRVAETISRHGVPFVMLFGNHDGEFGAALPDLYDLIQKTKNCIQPRRAAGVTSPDYILPILSHDGRRPAFTLYCLDSHSLAADRQLSLYQWITHEQVDWFARTADSLRQANGGTPLPALAFFHIPVPEFKYAANDEQQILIGTRKEPVCSPDVNSGLFLAMQQAGDVMGVFCGHDHDNDYCTLYKGLLLGYGRFSGCPTVYNDLPSGARVIVLHEGQRTFDSFIRLRTGETINPISYPQSFEKK